MIDAKIVEENKDNSKSIEIGDYVLTGVMFCGQCGASYHGRSKTAGRSHKRYQQYVCSSIDNYNVKNCKSKPISKQSIELAAAKILTEVLHKSISSKNIFKKFYQIFFYFILITESLL